MQKLQKIRELLKNLPKKDIPLAQKFIQRREIENLYDLVKADSFIVDSDREKPEEQQQYKDIDFEALTELYIAVRDYWEGIIPTTFTNDDYYEL